MNKYAVACLLAALSLASVGTPAAAQRRPAHSNDTIYTGAGLPDPATPRSTPAQNDPRSGFVGLNDPNRDVYDPGVPNYGARFGENYGGPGSTNDQASSFLGTPPAPPLTIVPASPPVTLTMPPPIIAPPGTVDFHGMPVQPGTILAPGTPFPLPSIPAPQTLTVAPWNPAETNSALH